MQRNVYLLLTFIPAVALLVCVAAVLFYEVFRLYQKKDSELRHRKQEAAVREQSLRDEIARLRGNGRN